MPPTRRQVIRCYSALLPGLLVVSRAAAQLPDDPARLEPVTVRAT